MVPYDAEMKIWRKIFLGPNATSFGARIYGTEGQLDVELLPRIIRSISTVENFSHEKKFRALSGDFFLLNPVLTEKRNLFL